MRRGNHKREKQIPKKERPNAEEKSIKDTKKKIEAKEERAPAQHEKAAETQKRTEAKHEV